MKYGLLALLVFLVISSHAQESPCNRKVAGQVVDIHSKEPLPFATVQIVGTSKGATTDESGHFEIVGICEDEIDLQVRFLGYKTLTHHHDVHHPDPTIMMATDATLLEGVVVEDTRREQLQTLSVSRKELTKLSMVSSSLGSLTGNMSGVSLLQTGTNISKPIVHGLHSNRVLVVNNGVRHAYQVWGQEHAPEIDPSHVDQIEIVKGAGTVKYGPDALGGVILYDSKTPAFDKDLHGSASTAFQTNGGSITSQVNVGQGFHRFAWDAGVFGTYQGDLSAPEYTLSNTGKREFGGSFNTVLHRAKFDWQVSGSYFQQDLGILRGSIVGNLDDLQRAIDRGKPSPTFPATYQLQNPRQKTKHAVIKTDLALFLGEQVFNFQYAFQYNKRDEFAVRRGELNDRPVIDLALTSHTFDAEWIQPEQGNWNGSTGIQLFTQSSINTPGANPVNFVPDYDVLNVGLFTVQSMDLELGTIELGARLDYQTLSVSDEVRETFTYQNSVAFQNGTFTLGYKKQLSDGLALYTNIGSAWRAPNVAELYSFGYHNSRLQFGLWRYTLEPEVTTPQDAVLDENDRSVAAEQGLKWVSGLEIEKGRTQAEFVFFANQINNYIFQRPFGISTNIAGTFPFFFYDQIDALFLGADLDIRYQHNATLSSELKVAYVNAEGASSGQALLEIPPLNVTYLLDYRKERWHFGINLSYTARQWNAPPAIEPKEFNEENAMIDRSEIFDFMLPPEDFFLLGTTATYQVGPWNLQVEVTNVLNTSYRNYTDRLRYFANAPGKNFIFSLEYKF